MTRTVCTFAVLFILFLMCFAQVVDFIDQEKADRAYCAAVRNGGTPDYRMTYLSEC